MAFFDFITMKKPPRSTFNKSHNLLTTLNIGDLVPCKFDFLLPGDRINLSSSFICKFSPLVSPAFARMQIKTEWFFVPFSQLYANYDKVLMNYKGESQTVISDGVSETSTFVNLPFINCSEILASQLTRFDNLFAPSQLSQYERFGRNTPFYSFMRSKFLDYMGLPIPLTTPFLLRFESRTVVNPTFIHRFGNRTAIQIYNNVATDGYVDAADWSDFVDRYSNISSNLLLYHKANTGWDCPISTFFARAYQKIYSDWYRNQMNSDPIDLYFNTAHKDIVLEDSTLLREDSLRYLNSLFMLRKRNYRKDYFNTASTDPTLGPDSVAIPQTVNDLRKANAIQRLLDKKAVSGPNFSDWLKYTWDVYADNYEVDRSIYLGGSTENVKISEVVQTSETSSESPLGQRGGEANAFASGRGINFVAPDYGVLVGLVSIRPEIDYYCGVPRILQKTTWEDFPLPELSQVGMQTVDSSELMFNLVSTGYSEHRTFGYVPRYQEFKTGMNVISGEFRDSLSFWHQSPNFYRSVSAQGISSVSGDLVGNNEYFSRIGLGVGEVSNNLDFSDPYYNNIFSVTSDEVADHCQMSMNFNYEVNRALPVEDMPHL